MAKEAPGLPDKQTITESPVTQILDFLSSMQLGIILILVLAVISAFATMREAEAAITNIYQSWWFLGILGFTALNLLLCTVRRVGPLSKLALHPNKKSSADAIRKMQVNRSFKVKQNDSQETAFDTARSAFTKVGLKVSVEEGPEGKVLFAERGKFGYFGSILTHISLLLILLGAMYGGLTGFEDRNGGIAGENFFVPDGSFRVDITAVRMEQEEDPTVRPRVYSDVVITKDGKELSRGTIAINEPMRFQGNSIYHSTFMYVSSVTIKDVTTGKISTEKFFDSDPVQLDSKGTTLHFVQFFPNFSMRPDGTPYSKNYLPEKPVLAGILVKDGKAVRNVFLLQNKTEVIETADGNMEMTLNSFENAAVYSITKNLGRPFLFMGAVFMIIGLYMSFFLFPRRFWAVFDDKKGALLVGGRAYRNRLGIEQDMERIETEIDSREGV